MTEIGERLGMRRVWVHWVVLGAIFAALCLFLLSPGSVSWLDVLVTFGVGGGIYALALSLPLARYLRRVPPDSLGCWAIVGIALLGSAGTVIAVVTLGVLQFPRGDWEQLPAPPEGAVEILASTESMAADEEILVRGTSGAHYAPCGDPSCEWVMLPESLEATEPAEAFCNGHSEAQYRSPFKAGAVRDEQVTAICGADYYVESHYRLMEDGSLWRWSRFSALGTLFLPLLTIAAGVILSVVVSIVYTVLRVGRGA